MAGTERVAVHRAKDGSFYFTHEAANGQVSETSETYTRLEDAERGARSAHPDLPVVIQPGDS